MKKDEIYNRFKRDLTRYHRKGFAMDYPSTETHYDKEGWENTIYIQVGFNKKGKEITEYILDRTSSLTSRDLIKSCTDFNILASNTK